MATDSDKIQQALRRTYVQDAFKEIQKGGSASAGQLEALAAASAGMTRAKLRSPLLGAKELGLLTKTVAELRIASGNLKHDAANRDAQTQAIKAYMRLEHQRRVLGTAGYGMPSFLAGQRLGAINTLARALGTDNKSLPNKLKKLAEAIPDENDPRSTGRGGRGYTFFDLFKHGARHAGMSSTASFMGAASSGMEIPKIPGPALAAIAAAVATVELPKMLLSLQSGLTGKYQAIGGYAQTRAQLSRYSGNPVLATTAEDTGLPQQSLARLFPQYASPQQVASDLAATRIGLRPGDDPRLLLNAINRTMAGTGLGGLGLDQTSKLFAQTRQLGLFHGNFGGDVSAPNGAQAVLNVFERATEKGMRLGFDKSVVAQNMSTALESMARNGAVYGGLPQSIYTAQAAGRNIYAGLANPEQVVSTLNTLQGAGRGILNNPALFMAGRNYITKNVKGKTFYDKLKNMGNSNDKLKALMKSHSDWSAEQIFTEAAQAGMFSAQIPDWINSIFGKGSFYSVQALQALGLSPGAADVASKTGRFSTSATANTNLKSTSQALLDLQKKMFGSNAQGKSLQKFGMLLQNNPDAAAAFLQSKEGQGALAALDPLTKLGILDASNIGTNAEYVGGPEQTRLVQTPTANTTKLLGLLMSTSNLSTKESAEQLANQATISAGSGIQGTQGITTFPELLSVQEAQANLDRNLLDVSKNWLSLTKTLNGGVNDLNHTIQQLIARLRT